MTLVELFGKYYNGAITDKKKIKEIYKKEIKIFKVIHPEDITDDGCYSIGDGNAILDIETSEFSKNEDFREKLIEFLDIILIKKGDSMEHKVQLFYKVNEKNIHGYEAYENISRDEEATVESDMMKIITPVRSDGCLSFTGNMEEDIRKICYNRAYELYGKDLPRDVDDRLEHELTSIVSSGQTILCAMAQNLVWKSKEAGYPVFARGSIGSLFVMFLLGVTDINPLPAHYYCGNCNYSDFASDEVKKSFGISGCDMPDKYCPICGKLLKKDGHNIPAESSIGLNGEKKMNISIDFSAEYQERLNYFAEVIFAKEPSFIEEPQSNIAEKIICGYIFKNDISCVGIVEKNDITEKNYIGFVLKRRTKDRCLRGTVILPLDDNMDDCIYVKENESSMALINEAVDYKLIADCMLKFGTLGNDMLTMIKRLEDMTGVKANMIGFDDEKVLSLFSEITALGIKAEELNGCDIGLIGLPMFNSDVDVKIFGEIKPKSFSDIVRVLGLCHGTGIWEGNIQELIKNNECMLKTAICTRDDILFYLTEKGINLKIAFEITESIRKGKGVTLEWENEMKKHNIPEWYINSCKKIIYLFPKAHEVSLATVMFRLGYYKLYYPHEYYTAYFSIRKNEFDYKELECGKEELLDIIKGIEKIPENDRSEKDTAMLRNAYVVLEMYLRGLEYITTVSD